MCVSRVCCAYILGAEYHSACLKRCFANEFPLNAFEELISRNLKHEICHRKAKMDMLNVFFLSFHGNLMSRVFLLQTLSVFVPQF